MKTTFAIAALRAIAPVFFAVLSACGGGSGMHTTPTPPGSGDRPPSLALQDTAVIKFHSTDGAWVAMIEKLRPIEDVTTPDRHLLIARSGDATPVKIDPPAGWSLIDFAQHPSGEISAVLATDTVLRLQRRAIDGALLSESEFVDAQAATDPFIGDIAAIPDSQSLVPQGTRDAVRLAAIAEDLLMTLRTGRNAVIEYRLAFSAGTGFAGKWRTLVEPGVAIDLVRLISGTFDPFKSLDNQWHVSLDVDALGRSAVAVSLTHTNLPNGHRMYFGEPIDPELISGAIVTMLDSDGQRLRATPLSSSVDFEVHALRWADDKVLLAGRTLTTRNSDGTGWDGFVAQVDTGASAPQLQTLDFDRGDIILEIAILPDGRIALGGSTGYIQNPNGGSISEEAEPLLAIMSTAAGTPQRLYLPPAQRQSQIRTVAAWREKWLIGGLQNGPGTHSADGNPNLLSCDGFLREQTLQ
jgi:hypothetical protein